LDKPSFLQRSNASIAAVRDVRRFLAPFQGPGGAYRRTWFDV